MSKYNTHKLYLFYLTPTNRFINNIEKHLIIHPIKQNIRIVVNMQITNKVVVRKYNIISILLTRDISDINFFYDEKYVNFNRILFFFFLTSQQFMSFCCQRHCLPLLAIVIHSSQCLRLNPTCLISYHISIIRCFL